jgi:outer membrane autotransporter protein
MQDRLPLEPFGNLAYVNLHTGSFDEKGGQGALHSRNSGMDTAFTTIGLRGSTDFALGGTELSANGSIGWRHAIGDVAPTSRWRSPEAANLRWQACPWPGMPQSSRSVSTCKSRKAQR